MKKGFYISTSKFLIMKKGIKVVFKKGRYVKTREGTEVIKISKEHLQWIKTINL